MFRSLYSTSKQGKAGAMFLGLRQKTECVIGCAGGPLYAIFRNSVREARGMPASSQSRSLAAYFWRNLANLGEITT